MSQSELLNVSPELLERLAVSGPRYTSYPTAPEWSDAIGETEALDAYHRAAQHPEEPLSLYAHLPFCERRCLYCGCTVEITQSRTRPDRYLDAVEKELEIVGRALGERRRLVQMHWGGGTPSFLSVAQLARLHRMITKVFRFDPDAEQSIEIDPHDCSVEQIDLLCDLGINRVSMGVQDFDEMVQKIVQRDQTLEETQRLVHRCRERGIAGLNVDLMYGLPGQTLEGFGRTLDTIIGLGVDRLAVFGYAHVPWMKAAQKALEKHPMPGPVERAQLFGLAIQHLSAAGYELIGLDHFAKPTDSLVASLRAGTMHRNFMGYTTYPADDMVGVGMSSIGDVSGYYLQNARDTHTYEARLQEGRLPTIRGIQRTEEDELRREVIIALMCRMKLDLKEIESKTGRTGLREYFSTEWNELRPFAEEGFCDISDGVVTVRPRGRLFLRHLAMVFDAYLRAKKADAPRFSKAI